MYISTQEAKKLQKKLREDITIQPLGKKVEWVAGADISYNRGSDKVCAGIAVLDYRDLSIQAVSTEIVTVDFPYIPGLLAFRELPPLREAWEQLPAKPDVVVMDGHGLAHPLRMGIATHFGIITGQPTIGCAKNVLTGDYEEPGMKKGDFTYLYDGKDRIGMVVRSRDRVKPIFVSPGHKVSFENAREIVMGCLSRYKLPETTRKAHDLVNRLRRGEIKSGYKEY